MDLRERRWLPFLEAISKPPLKVVYHPHFLPVILQYVPAQARSENLTNDDWISAFARVTSSVGMEQHKSNSIQAVSLK